MNASIPDGAMPPAIGMEQFDSLVNETFCPMFCQHPRHVDKPFQGALVSRQLGDVGFSVVKSSPLDVYRRRSHIGQACDASYLVKVQVEGEGVVRHRGLEAHLYPGDFTICLSSEPYELHFPRDYAQVVLSVPEALMEEFVNHPARHLGVRMDAKVGANGLFSQFVTSIAGRMGSLDGGLAQRLQANVLDLLVTSLGYARETQRRDLLNCGMKAEYLQRIRYFIRKNLDNELLGPDWIAEALNISTRYLHMLFEAEELSVSRYIQRLRLEACRAALADPAFADYSVSEIAYRSGFKDASHFSRVFKQEYGDTPARFRRNGHPNR